MTPNPFVEFAQDPVTTLAWLGYALSLAAFVVTSVWWSVRKLARLQVRYRKQRHTDDWWDGPFDIGLLPPPDWTATLAMVLLVWAVTAWAVGALVWIVAGGVA